MKIGRISAESARFVHKSAVLKTISCTSQICTITTSVCNCLFRSVGRTYTSKKRIVVLVQVHRRDPSKQKRIVVLAQVCWRDPSKQKRIVVLAQVCWRDPYKRKRIVVFVQVHRQEPYKRKRPEMHV